MRYVLVKNAELSDEQYGPTLREGEIIHESDDYWECADRIPHPLTVDSCLEKYLVEEIQDTRSFLESSLEMLDGIEPETGLSELLLEQPINDIGLPKDRDVVCDKRILEILNAGPEPKSIAEYALLILKMQNVYKSVRLEWLQDELVCLEPGAHEKCKILQDAIRELIAEIKECTETDAAEYIEELRKNQRFYFDPWRPIGHGCLSQPDWDWGLTYDIFLRIDTLEEPLNKFKEAFQAYVSQWSSKSEYDWEQIDEEFGYPFYLEVLAHIVVFPDNKFDSKKFNEMMREIDSLLDR